LHSCRLGQVNFIVPSLVADGNQDVHISLKKKEKINRRFSKVT